MIFCLSCFGFEAGDGSIDNPYQIATSEDLLSIGSDPNLLDKHFILESDIDLDPNLPGGKVFSHAIIDANFTGCFNGNGHTIQNLEINSSEDYVGIFGFIGSKGVVENLIVENVQIYCTGSDIGSITGKNWGTVRNCHVTGIVYGKSGVGGLVGTNGSYVPIRSSSYTQLTSTYLAEEIYEGIISACSANIIVNGVETEYPTTSLGCLAGVNSGGMILNSKSSGIVNGDNYIGGITGMHRKGLIANSYSESRVQGISWVGGLIGYSFDNIMLCYSTGLVTGDKYSGGLIGQSFGYSYLSYWDVQAIGLDFSSSGRGKTTEQMRNIKTFKGWGYENVWTIDNGNDYPRLAWENAPGNLIIDTIPEYAGGIGDVNDPYQIRTAEQLFALGYCWPDFNNNFILMQDIDFNDIDPNIVASIGVPAFPYSGIFDGNNNSISNFKYYNNSENYVGIFGCIGLNSVVKNISILNADIKGYNNTGILAGSNQGLIQNCFVSGCVDGYNYVGGLAGYNEENAVINLCSSDVDVNGTSNVGGLIGRNYKATITMSDSFAIVTANSELAGGLAGSNYGNIERCFSNGLIRCNFGAGGLVGSNVTYVSFPGTGIICDSYSNVIVEGEKYAGGLTGYHRGSVSRSYSTGMVSGIKSSGGLIGYRDTAEGLYPASIEDCYWDIQTSGLETSEGGVGLTTTQMKNQESFVNWDFSEIWDIAENQTYPFLRR
ncbi:MAG: hypothetical protein JXA96_18280 [Sedimentisphaerales bacterium]|nr:hypothetical protein [Sedimentisphaerales bacterium]